MRTTHWLALIVLVSVSCSRSGPRSKETPSPPRAAAAAVHADTESQPAVRPGGPARTGHRDIASLNPHASEAQQGAAATLPRDGRLGSGVSLREETPLAKLLADTKRYEGKEVRISGKVVALCRHRGAWFALGDDQGKPVIMIRTLPKFRVPAALKGKSVTVQGVVGIQTFTKERAAHLAKEHGLFGGVPGAIDGPRTLVTIQAQGVQVAASSRSAPRT